MKEYSRIVVENFCEKNKTAPQFERLAKIVARSYKIDSIYKSDEEANFVFDFIEHCADEELRKALIALDEFMVGY